MRYPTIGGGKDVEDAQPFEVTPAPSASVMAHNGNLTNFHEPLRDELHSRTSRRYIGSNCDVEVILNVFAGVT